MSGLNVSKEQPQLNKIDFQAFPFFWSYRTPILGWLRQKDKSNVILDGKVPKCFILCA